jgi:hypothetical protein
METLLVVLIVACAFLAALARLAPRALREHLPWLYRDIRRLNAPRPGGPNVVSRIDVKSLKATLPRHR